jgi:methyltransferase (TIGR00027 family)
MESERPDAIFNDPYARRLGGERGEAIVAHMPRGAAMAWAMIVRTAVMDELIMRCVKEGAKSVLNLAAGLDARPYRLALPSTLQWYHVDLPDMIGYVKERMAGETPRCRLEFVAADLTDAAQRRGVFERAAANGPVLVITEGLLIYLERDQVASLAKELREVAKAKWWISDLASPMLEKFMKRQWSGKLAAGNAPMKFFPPEGTTFFAPFGWREAEYRSVWTESMRLNRKMKMWWLWNLMGKLQSKKRQQEGQRMSGVVLYQSA